MKNRNRYTFLPILLFSLSYVIGCVPTTTAPPKGWLPSVSAAQQESYGGWVSVRYHTGDSESEVHGELIAVHANQILILTEQALIAISHDSISRMKLMIVQLSGYEDVDDHRQMMYPKKRLNAFRAYARFPQGLSKTFDMQFLKPKRSKIEVSVPTKMLEVPQKDRSMPLEDITEWDQAEVEAAVRQDANTYAIYLKTKAAAEQDVRINKLLWFGAGVGAAGSMMVGLAGGVLLASHIADTVGVCGGICVMGCGGSVCLSLWDAWTDSHTPNPPAARFIGKSPEYIQFYTHAYKSRHRQLRSGWEVGGVCAALAVVFTIWARHLHQEEN